MFLKEDEFFPFQIITNFDKIEVSWTYDIILHDKIQFITVRSAEWEYTCHRQILCTCQRTLDISFA